MSKLLLLLLMLLVPLTLSAQEPNDHAIDKALGVCTEKDPSTAGMVRCIDIAYQDWDKELNKKYQAAMIKLKPAEKATLKAAQLEWLKFREAEFKLLDTIYSKLQGTMYISMRLDQRMQIVRRRAMALASHADLLTESEQ